MDCQYQLALHMKTPDGYESYAEFCIGVDGAKAKELFRKLKGSTAENTEGIILMELRTIFRGLPIDIELKYCTLDQVTENCRQISKYVFSSLNFLSHNSG